MIILADPKLSVGCHHRCAVILFDLETASSLTVRKDKTTMLAGPTLVLSSRIWKCKFVALLSTSVLKRVIVCIFGLSSCSWTWNVNIISTPLSSCSAIRDSLREFWLTWTYQLLVPSVATTIIQSSKSGQTLSEVISSQKSGDVWTKCCWGQRKNGSFCTQPPKHFFYMIKRNSPLWNEFTTILPSLLVGTSGRLREIFSRTVLRLLNKTILA
jgi:hypothetical protein